VETIFYRPPGSQIIEVDTVFSITGVSGFSMENKGPASLMVGEPDNENIEIVSGGSRAFETPSGHPYEGNFSVKFATPMGMTAGFGRMLLIFNTPVTRSIDTSPLPDIGDGAKKEPFYKERIS
jgi:hypothetical protein